MSADPLEIATLRGREQGEFNARPIFLPVLRSLGGGCVSMTTTRLSSTRVRVDFSQPVDFFAGLVHPVNWTVEDEDGSAPNLAILAVTPEAGPSPTYVIFTTSEQRSGVTYRARFDTPCSGTLSLVGSDSGGGGTFEPVDTSLASIAFPRANNVSDPSNGGANLGPMPEIGGLTSLIVSLWFYHDVFATTVARFFSCGTDRFSIVSPTSGAASIDLEWGASSRHRINSPVPGPRIPNHLLAIYNGGGVGNAQRSRAWVNGVSSTLLSETYLNTIPASLAAPLTDLFMGCTDASIIGSVNGFMDDVAIWRNVPNPGALGDALALELFNRSRRLDLSQCSLGLPDRWYRGDGMTATSVPDLGGDGVDAALLGNAYREPFVYRRP